MPGDLGEVFTKATNDPWWWQDAKPIWVEAEQAGIQSGLMFWPGSAVAWGGTLQPRLPANGGIMATDWIPFSIQFTDTQRVRTILDWLRRPAPKRPAFLTLYFNSIDRAGHRDGPEGDEINAALRELDRHIGLFMEGLTELNVHANLVIVSDHGMAPVSSERVIVLDEVTDPSFYRVFEDGAYASLEPLEAHMKAVESALLAHHPHMQCWHKSHIPSQYQYGSHPRIPAYFCLADPGWTIVQSRPETPWEGGSHGYDPSSPSMAALFIANGPAFRAGARIETFQNTAIAPLLRFLIGLDKEPSDVVLDTLSPALTTHSTGTCTKFLQPGFRTGLPPKACQPVPSGSAPSNRKDSPEKRHTPEPDLPVQRQPVSEPELDQSDQIADVGP